MLKVMTLNLNYYGTRHGAWDLRRDLIAQAIQAAEPDIIAFQAVRLSPELNAGQDQATQLARLLPEYAHVYFQPAVIAADRCEDGSALISRLPWQETHYRELSLSPGQQEDQSRRVILAATFAIDGRPFNLFNAHFSWVPEQALSNVREAVLFLNLFHGPGLLVGDFNLTPESDLLEPLVRAGWSDAWGLLRPGQDGFTFVEDGRLSKRIDYAWVNAELKEELRDIAIVADKQHVSGARASDHAGLLVTLF